MNLDSLKELAKKLPKDQKDKAESLLTRMGEVIEGIGDEPVRWKPGMLRLVQGTTDRTTIPKGTAIGDMLLGEQKLEQPVKFIPLRMWNGRQYWSPDPNESKLLCSSPDAKLGYNFGYCNQCKFGVFNEETRKSECGKTKNILVIKSDLSDIFQITFSKTNYQTGMEIESLMKKAGVAPYRRVYGLASETNAKFKNVENFSVEILGEQEKVTPDTFVPFLQELFNVIGDERKDSIDKFYELVNSRKDQPALPSSTTSGGADSTVLIESEPASTEAGEAAPVSDMARNYVV
jgi:hypothetical protein